MYECNAYLYVKYETNWNSSKCIIAFYKSVIRREELHLLFTTQVVGRNLCYYCSFTKITLTTDGTWWITSRRPSFSLRGLMPTTSAVWKPKLHHMTKKPGSSDTSLITSVSSSDETTTTSSPLLLQMWGRRNEKISSVGSLWRHHFLLHVLWHLHCKESLEMSRRRWRR